MLELVNCDLNFCKALDDIDSIIAKIHKGRTEAKALLDVVGTGSFLPQRWTETYATADIIEYNGVKRVKVGREFLFRK